jgi:hypothetical protein
MPSYSARRTELIQRIALFCTRQASNNIAGQLFNFRSLMALNSPAPALFFFGVIRFSSRALQDVQFKAAKAI